MTHHLHYNILTTTYCLWQDKISRRAQKLF